MTNKGSEAGEQVLGLDGGLGVAGGGEGVALGLAELLEERAGLFHEGGLGAVLREGFLFAGHYGADVQGDGPRGGHGGWAIGEKEGVGLEEEAVGVVDGTGLGVAPEGGGPMVGGGGEEGSDGVVGMGVGAAVGGKGEDDVGAEGTDETDEAGGGGGKVGEL